jgi:hypothetical protein
MKTYTSDTEMMPYLQTMTTGHTPPVDMYVDVPTTLAFAELRTITVVDEDESDPGLEALG